MPQQTDVTPESRRVPGLWNPNFLLLWQGQLISQVGNQVFSVATIFWIKHETGSAALLGLLMMLSSLPGVILGPVGGTFADRHSRRAIIIVCDVLDGIAVLLFAALIALASDAKSWILVLLFIVSIFIGIVGAFFRPAISAAIPDILPQEKLATGNALSQFSFHLSVFVGVGLGGLLLRVLGVTTLILVNGVSYLFAAASEFFMTIPQKLPEKSATWRDKLLDVKRDTVDGFRYVWANPGMRILFFAFAFLNFFLMPIIMLFPFYVEDFLKATTDWYGYLMATFSVGMVIGGLLTGRMKLSGSARTGALIGCMFAYTAGSGALGLITSPRVALPYLLVGGMVNGFIYNTIVTILQLSTPSEIRGRVFGVLGTIASGLMPLAMGLAGWVADLTHQNIPLIFGACGSIQVLLTLTVALNRKFRGFIAFEPIRNEVPGPVELGEEVV
ncbi:MAG: MFS transporter [Acidobacteriota bacterium]